MHIGKSERSILVVTVTQKGPHWHSVARATDAAFPTKGRTNYSRHPGSAQFQCAWIIVIRASLPPPIPQRHKLAFQVPKYINHEHLHQTQILLPARQYSNHYVCTNYLLVQTHCTSVISSYTDSKARSCADFLSPSDKTGDILHTCMTKSGNRPTEIKVQKRNTQKKKWYCWKWHLNRMSMGIKSTAAHGNVDTVALWETQDMQPRESWWRQTYRHQ